MKLQVFRNQNAVKGVFIRELISKFPKNSFDVLFALQEVVEPVKPATPVTVKPDPVSSTPDLNATPVAKEAPKAEPKSDAKISRSGRAIKTKKYALV